LIFCIDCFNDVEIRGAIEAINEKGVCSLCQKSNVFIYNSDLHKDTSAVQNMLESILRIYLPESELPDEYPVAHKKSISERLTEDWDIFAPDSAKIDKIVKDIVENSLSLSDKILSEKVGIPELYNEDYLLQHSILKNYTWDKFKTSLRNFNRFHNDHFNLELLRDLLKDAEVCIAFDKKRKFYRARVSKSSGYKPKEMGAPPNDLASPGRVNSKGQSCLYLCTDKMTTVKEIRASAFDYVTIAPFKLTRDVTVLNLSSITHTSPFSLDSNDEKDRYIEYLINEKILHAIEKDLAKPMSRLDSELDYLPTQYFSDFAKACGYDGVQYCSTFNKEVYNIALFDPEVCSCGKCKTIRVESIDYTLS